MASLYSLELEKQFLSGTILNPSSRAETTNVQPSDLSQTNRVVLAAIDACLASDTPFSVFLLADRLTSLGIKIADSLEPGLYLRSLEGLAVGDKAVIGIAKQLKTVSIRRKLHETGQRIVRAMEHAETKKATELVAEATEIFNGQVNILSGGFADEPQDLFGGMEAYIEGIGGDPAEIGARPPYPIYHRLWGTFSPGDMSVYCARPKGSKSTFLMNTAEQCVEQDPDVMCLMLDTELETARVQRRSVAAITGVNEYHLRVGEWKKDRAMAAKVRAAWARVRQLSNRIHHIYVGSKSTDDMLSICRRWHAKHVAGRSKKAIICLDYIKLSSSDMDNMGQMKDYQLVGKRVDQFKQLATELQCHVCTAAQTNRSNEGRDVATRRSDGAAIGLSDFISQFSSQIFILERLTDEQLAMLGSAVATHTLTNVYARNLGPDGVAPMVQYRDERGKQRWTDNFVFYNIKNFRVEEVSDFRTIAGRHKSTGVPVQTVASTPGGARPLL